jgi:hypothetical protein
LFASVPKSRLVLGISPIKDSPRELSVLIYSRIFCILFVVFEEGTMFLIDYLTCLLLAIGKASIMRLFSSLSELLFK